MTTYQIEFSYMIPEWGDVILQAETAGEAEQLAQKYIWETEPEACQITIDGVKEVAARDI